MGSKVGSWGLGFGSSTIRVHVTVILCTHSFGKVKKVTRLHMFYLFTYFFLLIKQIKQSKLHVKLVTFFFGQKLGTVET
jgi:hypothetical protein